MKTTFISRKQAGVIYKNVKQGTIKMSKSAISAMYDVAGVEVFNDVMTDMIERLLAAVDAIFSGNIEGAQAELDVFSAKYAA